MNYSFRSVTRNLNLTAFAKIHTSGKNISLLAAWNVMVYMHTATLLLHFPRQRPVIKTVILHRNKISKHNLNNDPKTRRKKVKFSNHFLELRKAEKTKRCYSFYRTTNAAHEFVDYLLLWLWDFSLSCAAVGSLCLPLSTKQNKYSMIWSLPPLNYRHLHNYYEESVRELGL